MMRFVGSALLALAMLSQAAIAADRPFVFVKSTAEGKSGKGLAWWLRDKALRPYGKMIAGIPVEKLSAQWCFANAFSPSAFVSEDRDTQNEIDQTFRTGDISFSARTSFVGSTELAVTGVYETCDKRQGTFTAVIDQGVPVKVLALDTLEGEESPGFAAIKWNGKALEWGHCWECTWSDRLAYDPEDKRFYWEIRNYLN